MSTTYSDRDWVYSASIDDGSTYGGITVTVTFGTPVTDAQMDSAMQAFFSSLDASWTITSTSKQRLATGLTDWSYTP